MNKKMFMEKSRQYEESLDENYRKEHGIYYTDIKISESIIDFLNIPEDASVIDANCGTGSFLYSLKQKGFKNITGCDFEQTTVSVCRNLTGLKSVYCADTIWNCGEYILQMTGKPEGFDYVIGNPPYVSLAKSSIKTEKTDFRETVRKSGNSLYVAAIYRAFEIAADDGIISLIIPKNFLHVECYKLIRQKILQEKEILSIINLGICFKGVRGEQIVLTFRNRKKDRNSIQFYKYQDNQFIPLTKIKQECYKDEILIFSNPEDVLIYYKMINSHKKLADMCVEKIHRGRIKSSLKTGDFVRGRQIRKFGFKDIEIPLHGNQIFLQSIFSTESGVMASFAGNLTASETVTVVRLENEKMCRYILGLLHTRICNYFLIRFCFNNSKLTIKTDAKYLNNLPIAINEDSFLHIYGLVKKIEETEYMSAEWFELNEKLNDAAYKAYGILQKDRYYIECEMRKIYSKKWHHNIT